jgi:hypothetical protein
MDSILIVIREENKLIQKFEWTFKEHNECNSENDCKWEHWSVNVNEELIREWRDLFPAEYVPHQYKSMQKVATNRDSSEWSDHWSLQQSS